MMANVWRLSFEMNREKKFRIRIDALHKAPNPFIPSSRRAVGILSFFKAQASEP